VNLYLNAVDVRAPGRDWQFVADSGEAMLVVEVRDSMTNALLGRFLDRRGAGTDTPQLSNRVTTLSDFRLLFRQWAQIAVAGLGELKAMSPIPQDLKPGQKLH
jgi:hypothetical protein